MRALVGTGALLVLHERAHVALLVTHVHQAGPALHGTPPLGDVPPEGVRGIAEGEAAMQVETIPAPTVDTPA
eukprot:1152264-Prorocentrum_minimum.AAC.1